ncbi:MAG: hypothetical protein M3406_00310 [Chloroflexota bacterium]|nr:hypothetical protein [Chloroflexota bacterium]
MTRLRDHPDDLAALVAAASAQLALPLADVEKDLWVVELLRSIARPLDDGFLIFKGGTSLSKAYASSSASPRMSTSCSSRRRASARHAATAC